MDRESRLTASSQARLGAPGGRAGEFSTEVGLLLDAAKEAEKVLEQEARAHPTYADVRHRLGLLRLLRGDPAAGEREFEEALGINPGYRAAYYGLRLARMLQGTPPGEFIDARDSGSPLPEEASWRAADAYYAAELTSRDDRPAVPGDADDTAAALARHYAFYFALRQRDFSAARRYLEEAMAHSPTAGDSFARLGFEPWPGDEAAVSLAEHMLWTPLAEDLYTYLARIYGRNGLREKAVDCYDRSYCVFPRRAQHAMYRADLAAAFGEERQAIALLTEAIEADPTCTPARIALGYEYASQGYLEEARTQFEVACNLAPDYADVRYNLGLLHVGEGRIAEALEAFRRALAINPAYLPARHSMAHLLCRAGRYEEGLREYGRILKQGFQSSDMLVQMGKAAMALERPEEALQFLERAIFLNPEFAPSYYYIGQAFQRKGLKNKARSAWRSYLEKANDWEPLGPVTGEDEEEWAS